MSHCKSHQYLLLRLVVIWLTFNNREIGQKNLPDCCGFLSSLIDVGTMGLFDSWESNQALSFCSPLPPLAHLPSPKHLHSYSALSLHPLTSAALFCLHSATNSLPFAVLTVSLSLISRIFFALQTTFSLAQLLF